MTILLWSLKYMCSNGCYFVFGSNLAGRHGAGSALAAYKNYGAIYGQGYGPQGNSYAIPTKDYNLKIMTLDQIAPFVNMFISYAYEHPEKQFNVVDIGCGLAGYKPEQIAPLFKGAPKNCKFSKTFTRIITECQKLS